MPWKRPWAIACLLAWVTALVVARTPERISSDIYDETAFQSQFNSCPTPCSGKTPENWTVYSSFKRLSQCDRPMLFDLAIHTPINDRTKSLASDTIPSMIDRLSDRHTKLSNVTVSMLAQICGQQNDMDHTAGVAIALETDIDYVQSALLSWNQAERASKPKGADGQSTFQELIVHQVPLPAAVTSAAKVLTASELSSKRSEGFKNIADLLDTPANAKYCTKHQIAPGESCASIAKACKISVADFLKYNDVKGDGDEWCRKLQAGKNTCCSSGSSKPLPEDNGDCFTHTIKAGDDCSQKPGTVSPGLVTDASALAKLDPCPLNSCCNIWGQCGIDSLFCNKAEGPTGNPGTAPPDSNGCISNCGTDIVNNNKPPSSGFQRIGYYEAFNWERPCLHMRSEMSNTQNYTHMHWAFGDVKSDMSVSDVKKIVSFGGWGFSTGVASYEVLRKAMSPESRDRFVSNIVSFVKEAVVDGIDLDWEYPGAPDIHGIPAGLPSDTRNYLDTLRALRKALPTKYSVSIAVPASYWYLRPFPIQEMSQVVDYIVYMAYDLHVTKAGVKANKVVVGESSYGRSFRMAKTGCTGPDCTFTVANGQSDAAKGRCTNASGYLSNAEINEIISKPSKSKKTWFDKDTASDYLVYDDVEWVAYMSDHTK
ncbi:glycoside hydrolase superfamily [Trichoderma afarasin]